MRYLDLSLARQIMPELADSEDAVLAELDTRVAVLNEPGGVLAGTGFEEIVDTSIRQRFTDSMQSARQVATLLGISIPSAEAFTLAGTQIGRLVSLASEDETLLLVAAPHGLGVTAWQNAFESFEVSLDIAAELLAEIELLDRVQEASVPTVLKDGVTWSLRLVPAGPKPPVVGMNHSSGTHPTIAEMLMLQAIKLFNEEEVVDKTTFTWLAGSVSGARLAARHVFDSAQGRVSINSREIGNQGPHMGSRPPQW